MGLKQWCRKSFCFLGRILSLLSLFAPTSKVFSTPKDGKQCFARPKERKKKTLSIWGGQGGWTTPRNNNWTVDHKSPIDQLTEREEITQWEKWNVSEDAISGCGGGYPVWKSVIFCSTIVISVVCHFILSWTLLIPLLKSIQSSVLPKRHLRTHTGTHTYKQLHI